MPRQIYINPQIPTSNGVVIRRHTLTDSVAANATLKQARQRARDLVLAAEQEAGTIRHSAFSQGFREGYLDHLTTLHQNLASSVHLQNTLENRVKERIHTALKDSLQQPELILSLLENWFKEEEPITPVRVILPHSVLGAATRISHSVRQVLGKATSISVGNNESLCIACGDQVWEFSPTRLSDDVVTLAEQQITALNVASQCQGWSERAIADWLTQLTTPLTK